MLTSQRVRVAVWVAVRVAVRVAVWVAVWVAKSSLVVYGCKPSLSLCFRVVYNYKPQDNFVVYLV